MRSLPVISRADLLRMICHCGERRKPLSETEAALFGFMPLALSKKETGTDSDRKESEKRRKQEIEREPGVYAAPESGMRRLKFYQLVRAESRDPDPPPLAGRRPPMIDEAALGMPREKPAPPRLELTPWSRLSSFVRHSLGDARPSHRIDMRKMIRQVATGRVYKTIPRVIHSSWAEQAVVVLDFGKETEPFHDDITGFWKRLARERGRHGLKVISSDGAPRIGEFAGMEAGVPVFVLSAMGQLGGSDRTIKHWLSLAALLSFRGLRLGALIPCPRQKWNQELVLKWQSAMWDRLQRMPRRRGFSAIPADEHDSGTEALLCLLSTAAIISPALLREVRLLLGSRADVGAEYEAWNHPDCWSSFDSLGFRQGRAFPRMQELARITDDIALKIDAASAIAKHHEQFSMVLWVETLLRIGHTGSLAPDDEPLRERCLQVLKGVVEKMRGIATRPGGEEGERSGLPAWFRDFVTYVPPDLRNAPGIGELVAQGLALAHRFFGDQKVQWAEGINMDAAEEEWRRSLLDPGVSSDFDMVLSDDRLQFVPHTMEKAVEGLSLGVLSARRRQIHVKRNLAGDELAGGKAENTNTTYPLGNEFSIQLDEALESLVITTDLQTLEFHDISRPAWAKRMGNDRYGLWAELEIKGVPVRMRWIPPGVFAPSTTLNSETRNWEKSVTRWQDWGNEVITEGFWMAATPTTQRLWHAVTGRNSSAFRGDERPVESVTAGECLEFCKALSGICTGLWFDLPNETEWRYACAAGYETIYGMPLFAYDMASGELGWINNNSKNATHPVGLKKRNPWGLYDTIGNVGEFAYAKGPDSDPNGVFAVLGGSFDSDDSCSDYVQVYYRGEAQVQRPNVGMRFVGRAKSSPSELAAPWAHEVRRDEYGLLAIVRLKEVEFVFRRIPAGKFMMGSPETEQGRYSDEGPRHEVTLTEDFWLAATPTTQAQWKAVTGQNPSYFKDNGARRPVEQVTWDEVREYVKKLNALIPGLNARLPTEAQWEYACRAGMDSAFNDGTECTVPEGQDPALEKLGWHAEGSEGGTHEVARKQANAWGLYDMHGNVWEWCLDGQRTYSNKPVVNPVGPMGEEKTALRVLRGGGCWDHAWGCRSAARDDARRGGRARGIGFRLAAGQELAVPEAGGAGRGRKERSDGSAEPTSAGREPEDDLRIF